MSSSATNGGKEKQTCGFGNPPKVSPREADLKGELNEEVCGMSRDIFGVHRMPGFTALEGTLASAIIPEGHHG